MSKSKIQKEFAIDVAHLILFINAQANASCTFGEAYRTAEQAMMNTGKYSLVDKETGEVALEAPRRRGVAKSAHCDRLAVDLNLFINGKYATDSESYRFAGEYWESLRPGKNVWGGRFKDGNHFERRV